MTDLPVYVVRMQFETRVPPDIVRDVFGDISNQLGSPITIEIEEKS